MTSRDTILEAVRRNEPKHKVPLPKIPTFSGYDDDRIGRFRSNLERMGGRWAELGGVDEIPAKLAELFPEVKVTCSAVPEIEGTRSAADVTDPRQLQDVDVGIVRGRFGVAETGSVWLTDTDLVVNALGFLPQHLVVLLDPAQMVGSMHDAYKRIDLGETPYGCFMTGPSATADIEGVLIHGAQGVRSLTVLLVAG
jgi:L-lactate dehydrogenase complex protein LldG